jgi:outer membrane protein TolC
LLAANFTFNNIHRDLAFQVAEGYYRMLDALNQEDAARLALADAQTVQDAVEARLANRLATLSDALEARSSAAEAQYELASVQGLEEVARGGLATVLGVAPSGAFRIQDVSVPPPPENLDAPDRHKRVEGRARLRDRGPGGAQTRSGQLGHSNAFGQQKGGPEVDSSVVSNK